MRWAFTWWPGMVSGRDLQLVVHDSSVELQLNVARFDLHLSMLALPQKSLRTTRTRLSGVSLRIRKTRFLDQLCAQPAGLPPIEGQADPPGETRDCVAQRETAKPKGPRPRPEDLFHLSLEKMDVTDLHEVWIESWRSVGDLSFNGRWAFWPLRSIELGVTDLQARGMRLTQGDRQMARDYELSLDAALAPLQLEGLDVTALWAAVTAQAALRIESFELQAIRGALLRANPIAPPKFPALDGLANLQSVLQLDAGHVRAFSLDVRAQQAAVELLDRKLKGALRAGVELHEQDGRLAFTQGRVSMRALQLDGQRFDDVEIALAALGASHLEPRRQLADIDFSAEVSKVRFLIALIPGGLPRTIAKLLLDDGAPAVAHGTLRATSTEAAVRGFHADAGGLTLDGGFLFAPRLDGTLTAKYGVLSKDIALGH